MTQRSGPRTGGRPGAPVWAGAAAGMLAGGMVGLAEAAWVSRFALQPDPLMPWWALAAYALLMLAAGLAVGIAFALVGPPGRGGRFLALVFGLFVAGGAFILGRFHYNRDVLHGEGLSLLQTGVLALVALGAGIVCACLAAWLCHRTSRARAAALLAVVLVLACGVLSGLSLATSGREPAGAPEAPATQATGPNVILIVIDALRADYLPLYSDRAEAATPNFRAFAKDAVVFDQCAAQCSWTRPSFATLFTGRHPKSHTVQRGHSALPGDVVTVAEAFAASGYYTKGFANNGNISPAFNFQQGFHDYVDLNPLLFFHAPFAAGELALYKYVAQLRQGALMGRIDVEHFYRSGDKLTRLALGWLDGGLAPEGTPFFLFLHYMEPHTPYMDADEPGKAFTEGSVGRNPAPGVQEAMRKAYIDEIERVDRDLGALFAGLRERGLYDESAILITADHGEEFDDHCGWFHGETLYEEQLHVPLLVKLPSNQGGGSRNTGLARHMDVAPTLLALAGCGVGEGMQGVPLLDADGAALNEGIGNAPASLDYQGNVLDSVRDARYKIICASEDNSRGLDIVELYDLEQDPAEQNNLSGSAPAQEMDLLAELRHAGRAASKSAVAPAWVSEVSPGEKDRLENLGYF